MANNTVDKYTSLKSLLKENKEGVDFEVEVENRISPVSVIAFHGGQIEEGTTEIAREIARLGQYKYYSFIGKKQNKNLELHITSTKFDHKPCMEMVVNSVATIAVHGADEPEDLIYVGGKNFVHAHFIKYELRLDGFKVVDEIRPGLEGYSPLNLCNRNMRNAGVQLELSEGLRARLFGVPDWKKRDKRSTPTNDFKLFNEAIFRATQHYLNIP